MTYGSSEKKSEREIIQEIGILVIFRVWFKMLLYLYFGTGYISDPSSENHLSDKWCYMTLLMQ